MKSDNEGHTNGTIRFVIILRASTAVGSVIESNMAIAIAQQIACSMTPTN